MSISLVQQVTKVYDHSLSFYYFFILLNSVQMLRMLSSSGQLALDFSLACRCNTYSWLLFTPQHVSLLVTVIPQGYYWSSLIIALCRANKEVYIRR